MKKKYKILLLISVLLYAVYYFIPYNIEGIGFYDKIWAHRVNSLEKLNSAVNYFEGVELDLVYDEEKDVLDINHAPTISINLYFQKYIGSLNDKQPYLWLDVKNLNEENALNILNRISQILDENNYPFEKVLIESRKPKQLAIFHDKGYKTSFYLPYDLQEKEDDAYKKEISKINKVLREQNYLAISTSFKDYAIIKKEFPNSEKYIWAITKPIHFNFFRIREILNDEKVKVLLLKYNALKGNR